MAQNSRSLSNLASASALTLACLSFWSCDSVKRFIESDSKNASKPSAPAGGPSASASAEAKKSWANAEILQEMFKIVLLRDTSDRAGFVSFVDTMNQGASIEGLYNGFTLSADYRELETRSPVAHHAALKAFVEELTLLERELPEPTKFTEVSAQPLPKAVQPTELDHPELVEGGQPKDLNFPALNKSPSPAPSAVAALAAEKDLEKTFSKASIFTLKRVLGSEALKVIQIKHGDPAALQRWYGPFAARTAMRKVDFGLPQRNQADEGFHVQWAKLASEDQLVWETLNRLHRILNAAQALKVPGNP